MRGAVRSATAADCKSALTAGQGKYGSWPCKGHYCRRPWWRSVHKTDAQACRAKDRAAACSMGLVAFTVGITDSERAAFVYRMSRSTQDADGTRSLSKGLAEMDSH
ncbi:hypothetical protein ANO11243_003350 [Dothideomycetidae sp. 11243]|nr:hypothetical protein ANO11243_003350 [fungal sp. No.11243]